MRANALYDVAWAKETLDKRPDRAEIALCDGYARAASPLPSPFVGRPAPSIYVPGGQQRANKLMRGQFIFVIHPESVAAGICPSMK
ncbi:hypothetical protein [Sphingomonas crocodyli]|uniref:Uncharacterized protein n=1 Tax=Sphingomonas crocodyli TaxID=1979270 RepID=A0A437LXU0_9SPHN|nr:hypothetical protein [Sphingomonas crocodyli]RVT90220.1 hypothetical protein EOD43_18150 [Sphingomonas crocodyli]